MFAKITKIDEMKLSHNEGEAFRRVYFRVKEKMDSKESIWAKTDLVPTFRNYGKWKDILKVGNILSGIKMKTKDAVDADSPISVIGFSELNVRDFKV